MKNWTGKFCRLLLLAGFLTACSHTPEKPAAKDEVDDEVSLKEDHAAIEELRKDIPEETRKSNDRLAESLKRWKIIKTPPEDLREKFGDEIRKMRETLDKKQKRMREDFQRKATDRRKELQDKQKEERDEFFAKKPTSEKRTKFSDDQSNIRERFNEDERDVRDEFEDAIKAERKKFEDEMNSRWSEFRLEFPEYSRVYKEMKEAEDKKREDARANPTPYAGWPYKGEGRAQGNGSDVANPHASGASSSPDVDVNKGGNGWPATDPEELDSVGRKPGH